ncbi:MAG: peptidoglycan editing factor PgeF [Candidatus Omnitrophota bacterium]|nr:peptidoglycan editing factor PgeF [Candidatus Omnitrophota bacterium]
MLKKNKHAYFFHNLPPDKVLAIFSDRTYNLGFYSTASQKLRAKRQSFLKPLGINFRNLVCTKQPHLNKIILIKENHKGKGSSNFKDAISGVDGLITKTKHLPLAVFSADCLSIFLFDPKNEAVGLLHAGWRGTYKKISQNAILKMQKIFGTNPNDLLVSFGPAIRKCCYEVGFKFRKYFSSDLIKRKNKLFLDLIEANLKQLINTGVKKKNIFDCKICTSCQNKRFFSYRREKEKAGRMMSLMMLK